MDLKSWGKRPMESSLPHEIVDAEGRRRAQLGPWVELEGERGVFRSKSAATRYLKHSLIQHYDRRRHGPDDPRTWAVRPLEPNK